MKTFSLPSIELLQSNFWLLAIAVGLVAIQLTLTWKTGNSDRFSISLLFWGAVLFLLRKNEHLSLESGAFSSFLRLSLIAMLLFKLGLGSGFVAGRRYRYSHEQLRRMEGDRLSLEIEMRYLRGSNLSFSVKPFIQQYTPVCLPLNQPFLVRQQQLSSCALVIDQKRAYLGACLHSWGGSTVTSKQFNRITYEVHFSRLLPQLLGQSLVDRRCLWAHLCCSNNPGVSPICLSHPRGGLVDVVSVVESSLSKALSCCQCDFSDQKGLPHGSISS